MPHRTISTLLQRSRQRQWSLLLLIVALLINGSAAGGGVDARLSRNPISIDESFQLILKSDSATDGDPELGVLEQDFQILSRSQSQNMQLINGKVSRSKTWNITLMARRSGRLTIPAISFGSDSSNPLTIVVEKTTPPKAGLSGDDIFLKVETAPQQAYPGEQILLTVQLYRAVSTDNASLSQPEFDDPDILIKKLGEDEQYETRIAGRRYLVVERRYALFTRRSGTLNLAPLVFQGEVIAAGSRRDSLFNNPFGRFGAPGEVRRVRSKPIGIEIKQIPPQTVGEPWLPSSNLQLVENWGQESGPLTVGEPVTRTLMLFADGLTSAQLPEVNIELPDGLKQYPDQPVLHDRESRDGITGIRQIKVAIVPNRSGSFTLPAINVNWWNLAKREMEIASIPERRIEVLPALAAEPLPSAPVDAAEPRAAHQAPATSATVANAVHPWTTALSVFLGLGWFGTSIGWWFSAKRAARAGSAKPQERGKKDKADKAALRAACLANEPEATARALLEWGRFRWPDSPPRTLGAIAEKSSAPGLKKEIAQLERHLYAGDASPWLGADLWRQLEQERRGDKGKPKLKEPVVASLHPG